MTSFLLIYGPEPRPMAQHYGVTPWTMHRCTHCSFRTVVYRKFCKHMRSHEDRSDFSIKCFHCPKAYVILRQFQRHIEWHNVLATRDGADIRSTDHQSNEDRDAVPTSPEIMGQQLRRSWNCSHNNFLSALPRLSEQAVALMLQTLCCLLSPRTFRKRYAKALSPNSRSLALR